MSKDQMSEELIFYLLLPEVELYYISIEEYITSM